MRTRPVLVGMLTVGTLLAPSCGSSGTVSPPSTAPVTTTPAPSTTAPSPTVPPATTAPGTTTRVTVAPSTVAPTTVAPTTVAPVPVGRPWVAALRSDGTLEAWAKDGKRLAVPTCALPPVRGTDPGLAACAVPDVAVTASSLWYVLRSATGSAVMRAPLDGGAAVALAGATTDPDESFRELAVSADESTVWVTHAFHGDRPVLLERIRGGVRTTVATSVTGLALSPDGRRLAYAQFGGGEGASGPTGLHVVDVADGTTLALPLDPREGAPPFSLVDLSWSGDNRHLAFATSWEGQAVLAIDVDAATSANDAIVPQVPLDVPGSDVTSTAVQQACWTGPTTLALGSWAYPYADAPPTRGDVYTYDVRTRTARPAGASLFGQGYGDGMACRSDGAVAVVDGRDPLTAWGDAPGDLVVVRTDGTRTVLGRDYQRVFAA